LASDARAAVIKVQRRAGHHDAVIVVEARLIWQARIGVRREAQIANCVGRNFAQNGRVSLARDLAQRGPVGLANLAHVALDPASAGSSARRRDDRFDLAIHPPDCRPARSRLFGPPIR
jgi:hypothetical protein